MTWFKVDDGFWSHPKVMDLSDSAVALWVRAGAYCCQHLTDGVVSSKFLRVLGDEKAAAELVESGLWRELKAGYKFHDWNEYQETSDTVKDRRKQARERMRKVRAGRKSSPERSQDVRANNTRTTSERSQEVREKFATPDPTRPDPTRPPIKTYDQSAAEPHPGFDEFWDTVPRKVGKTAAIKAWDKATQSTSAEVIIDGMRRYRDDPNRKDEFTAHPATWLNHGRWDDDPIPARATSTAQVENTVENWLNTTPHTDWDAPIIDAELIELPAHNWEPKGENPW